MKSDNLLLDPPASLLWKQMSREEFQVLLTITCDHLKAKKFNTI